MSAAKEGMSGMQAIAGEVALQRIKRFQLETGDTSAKRAPLSLTHFDLSMLRVVHNKNNAAAGI